MSKIAFAALGGGSSIGASSYLLRINETTILIDFGIDPRHNASDTFDLLIRRAAESGIISSLTEISALALSHAHTDHSGLVPALYRYLRENTDGHIPYFYATNATKHLLPFIWRNVLQFGAAPFDETDAEEAFRHFREPESDHALDWLFPSRGKLFFYPTSHLLGSTMVEIQVDDSSVIYTGDLRLEKSPTLPKGTIPERHPNL